MQNKTLDCKDLTAYAKNILNLVDDLAASAISLKYQGYLNFIHAREDLKKLIDREESLCRNSAGKLCRFSTLPEIFNTISCVLSVDEPESLEKLDSAIH